MEIKDKLLEAGERCALSLRGLYAENGYEYYRMSKFEEYDFYAKNKDFLLSDNVLTFTDTNGKLMALKPDVTLSIVKGCDAEPKGVRKVYYSEKVYRPAPNDSYREITQTGLECFGELGAKQFSEVVTLASESLALISGDCLLALSDLNLIGAVLDAIGFPAADRMEILQAIAERNADRIDAMLLQKASAPDTMLCAAKELFGLSASLEEAIGFLREKQSMFGALCAFSDLIELLEDLRQTPKARHIRVDGSVVGDLKYYSGVIFQGFVRSIPEPVLTGGRYDSLMHKLGKRASAIGFAAYTDLLDRYVKASSDVSDDYLSVALPKGRLGEQVYRLFAAAGYPCPELLEDGRKLVFVNEEKRVRYFWVKPLDVPIYVERGVADLGVAGKDVLVESAPDVYELLDLKKGVCRMAVAGKKDFRDDFGRPLRVATKFASVARDHYRKKDRDIEIIHLNGSIEIAPLLGLSDVIVDIVETGNTLRANGLEVFEEVFPISARLIANQSAAKFKKRGVDELIGRLSAVLEEG